MIMSKVTSIIKSAVENTAKVRLINGAPEGFEKFIETWCSVMALPKYATRLGDYRLDEYLVTEQLKEAIMPRYVGIVADNKIGFVNLLDHKVDESKLMTPGEFIDYQAKLMTLYKKGASFNNLSLADAAELTLNDAFIGYALVFDDECFSQRSRAMCIPLIKEVENMIEEENEGWAPSAESSLRAYIHELIARVANS